MIKKINVTIFTFFFLFLSSVLGNERRNKIVDVINEELKEVARLSRQLQNKDPNLLLRMAELYLEIARIKKEEENEKYLNTPLKARQRISKKQFFKVSQSYFRRAQNIGNRILKKYKKLRNVNEVYYILAFNAKEFQQVRKAKRYFSLAIKKSQPNSKVKIKSQLALAEIYFNEKKFKKAYGLYKRSLRKKLDKWWTKNTFNLAWSAFRLKKYNEALNILKSVYNLSQNSNYIDMSYPVERDIAMFYVYARRINEGIQFYQDIGKDIGKQLVKLAKILQNQGRSTNAERVLIQAKSIVKDDENRIQVNLSLLKLYDTYGNFSKHYQVSRELFGLFTQKKLNGEQIQEFKFQAQKIGALLQKQVVGKTYRKVRRIRQQKVKMGTGYFDILSKIEPNSSYKYTYFKGETFYSVNQYDKAFFSYIQSYQTSKKLGKKKFVAKAILSMLATLGEKGLPRKVKKKYTVSVYKIYLSEYPRGKKSHQIYKRLFKNYIKVKNIGEAEKVLITFKGYYPKDQKTQEAMLASIMEHYRKRKNQTKLAYWLGRALSSEFKLAPSYAKKLKQLELNMQFASVEKSIVKGDKGGALQGYLDIYNNPATSVLAKKSSAYNIATIYFDINDTQNMFIWANNALKLMNPKNTKKFEKSFLSMSQLLFDHRKLSESAQLSKNVLSKICKMKSKLKDVFFKNMVLIYEASNNTNALQSTINNFSGCRISSARVVEANIKLLEIFYQAKSWSQYEKLLNRLSNVQEAIPEILIHYFRLANVYKNFGQNNKYENYLQIGRINYKKMRKLRRNISLEVLDIMALDKLATYEKRVRQFYDLKLSFPEKKFNFLLQKKLKLLDSLTTNAVSILKIGSGVGIVRTYKILIGLYQQFSNELANFRPPNKSKEYLKSFVKSMESIAKPIGMKAQEFYKTAQRQISSNKILAPGVGWFTYKIKNKDLYVTHYLSRSGLIMDRGGRK